MTTKQFFISSTLLLLAISSNAQVNARLFRYPDVSPTQISFSYAGDIWIVPKEGGVASRLSSPVGAELFARFSPDGKTLAYSANYDGNNDIYTIPVGGGIPKRLTYHSSWDRMSDWSPDGKSILFSSSRESGRQRFRQVFSIPADGGNPEKLPMPYADFASYSPDGSTVVFNFNSRYTRSWKRYKGGMAPDLWLFDLKNQTSKNITDDNSNDEFPMWSGNKIYYLSDAGPKSRSNIWSYDVSSGKSTQLTFFEDFDVHYPSIGPDDIVFEAGGLLYLLDLKSEQHKEVKIQVVTDQLDLTTRQVKTKGLMSWGDISPDGKRLVVSARGEIFSVPVEKGVTLNLTNTSGAAERFGSWSPDGRYIGYWSDESGEYQLVLHNIENGSKKTMTNFESGYKYPLFWSPDSRKVAYVDQTMDINYFDLDKNKVVKVDKGQALFQGGLSNFVFSWSSDSKWLTWSRSINNNHNAIFVYNTDKGQRTQLTSGYYDDSEPSFDPDGKYLYFRTRRNFRPSYSDMDGTFIYPNSTQIAAVTLRKDIPSPLHPENDVVEIKKDEDEEDDDEDEDEEKSVEIDFDGFEQRLVILVSKAGNYIDIEAVSGKLIYHQRPNTGSSNRESPIHYYDLEARESKTIVKDAGGFEISADHKKIAIFKSGGISVVDISADQKANEQVNLNNMTMDLDPMEEWHQIFRDAWRLERDFFYDKNMHGVDWEAMRDRYGALVSHAATRWDINFLLGELIGELNASHTYRGGGDLKRDGNNSVGYLGVDWKLDGKHYQIGRIVRGAQWDAEVRSPFDQPGVDVREGDYLISVNGRAVEGDKPVYAAFQGLGGQTVELGFKRSLSDSESKKVIIEALSSEMRLRHLEWIEHNRKRVEEGTNGRAGYIYVRSTGIDGQNELVRQFSAQFDKDALIIDERFNSGGQIPDRFVELLNRKPLAYFAVRDGRDWQWPYTANFGPKIMLINGWSGSGGDAFPDYFRKSGLGPLLGTTTWGGLIGISGAPSLIDGGVITVPTFRMYDPDGKWFPEGHGVDPDIEVKENPGELSKGTDGQLEEAIKWINEQLKNYDGKVEHEEYEDR